MTLQEVFNTVWQKFIVEKQPRNRHQRTFAAGSLCSYKPVVPGNTVGCFLGACMPPELRDNLPKVGNTAIDNIMSESLPVAALFDGCPPGALCELQNIHDSNDSSFWKDMLVDFARSRQLVVPEEAK